MKTMSKNVNMIFASSILHIKNYVKWCHGGTLFTMYFKTKTKTEVYKRFV